MPLILIDHFNWSRYKQTMIWRVNKGITLQTFTYRKMFFFKVLNMFHLELKFYFRNALIRNMLKRNRKNLKCRKWCNTRDDPEQSLDTNLTTLAEPLVVPCSKQRENFLWCLQPAAIANIHNLVWKLLCYS